MPSDQYSPSQHLDFLLEELIEEEQAGAANIRAARRIEKIADDYEQSVDRTSWWN